MGIYTYVHLNNCSNKNLCSATISKSSHEIVLLEYHSIRERIIIEKLLSQPLDQQIGQMFMLTIHGQDINDEISDLLTNQKIGGIVLLSENISSKEQLAKFTSDINSHSIIKPFIAVDQEGGTVVRISWDRNSHLSQYEIAHNYSEDIVNETLESRISVFKAGGINTTLGPVLDICSPDKSFLSTRCFSDDPLSVSLLGSIYLKHYNDAKIITSAKHFPNHGNTIADSHQDLPIANETREELMNKDLVPYKEMINNNVPMIMIGHMKFPNIDNEKPTSLSKRFQTEILRNEMRFEGIIISDDIEMGALDNYPNKVLDAINAGTDIIIATGNYTKQIQYIHQLKDAITKGEISEKRLKESVKRIYKVKCRYEVLDECK